MICHKCFKKIEGESSGRVVNGELEFYHLECAPEGSKSIDPKITERVRGGVVKIFELLGCEDADTPDDLHFYIRIKGTW